MNTLELSAAILGTQAHKDGRKPVPCQDRALLALVAKNPNREIGASLPLLEAWSNAWHLANRFMEVNK